MIAIHSVFLVTLLKITHAGAETETRTCGPMPRLPVPLYTNWRLQDNEISVLDGIDLERCVLECFLISRCASLNYVYVRDYGVRRCELNWVTSAGVGKREYYPRYVYYDFAQWTHFHALAGSCADRPCDENQRCIPTSPHTCANVDCGPPPSSTLSFPPWLFHVTATSGMTSLGNHKGYTCNSRWATYGYIAQGSAIKDVGYTICSSNSQWTKLLTHCFSYINTCQDVQACNPGSPDGHYYVYPDIGSFYGAVIVYCGNMTTSTPYTDNALPGATPADVIEHACATDLDI